MAHKSLLRGLFAFEEEEELEEEIQNIDNANKRQQMLENGEISAEEYFFMCGVDDANGE